MATETRTVTDADRILAGILVAQALEQYLWLPEEKFERLWQELTEELLWTKWGRERLRELTAPNAARSSVSRPSRPNPVA